MKKEEIQKKIESQAKEADQAKADAMGVSVEEMKAIEKEKFRFNRTQLFARRRCWISKIDQ